MLMRGRNLRTPETQPPQRLNSPAIAPVVSGNHGERQMTQ
ncbi:hypothetical protein RISK_006490 [Rhodopirellula islandica]|uniref:Uncharacterized protein n=1 Tax=Rhodopirellula islandica TaxID=595434 RepID=A0A0J1E798_RHOIS|nr:hypothetical protein RISK_006490 [Rhodopirellula islandica]